MVGGYEDNGDFCKDLHVLNSGNPERPGRPWHFGKRNVCTQTSCLDRDPGVAEVGGEGGGALGLQGSNADGTS